MSYTGFCPLCYLPFGECRCSLEALVDNNLYPKRTGREDAEDLLNDIGMHCQIGELIMEQKADYLLPSILEDIYDLALCLPEYFEEE